MFTHARAHVRMHARTYERTHAHTHARTHNEAHNCNKPLPTDERLCLTLQTSYKAVRTVDTKKKSKRSNGPYSPYLT